MGTDDTVFQGEWSPVSRNTTLSTVAEHAHRPEEMARTQAGSEGLTAKRRDGIIESFLVFPGCEKGALTLGCCFCLDA